MGHFRPSSTIITRKVDGPSNYFILYFRVVNIRTLWCYVMQPSWKATIRSDEFRSNCFSLHYIFPVLFTCFPRVIVICEDTVRLKHNSREMLIFAIQTLTLQVTIRELVSHWLHFISRLAMYLLRFSTKMFVRVHTLTIAWKKLSFTQFQQNIIT